MTSAHPAQPQPPETPPQQPEAAAPQKHSYGEILKSSALIGGSQVLTIAIGIVRTKAMAVLLGPAGFGLMGLYGSIIDLVFSIASLGIGSSGVRQIAESVGSGNNERIARTVIVLRKTAVLLGILGALLMLIFSAQLSTLTFGDDRHRGAVALLALAVFFRSVTAGQQALIQGMRRIADLARIGVIGALLGTVISIVLVYFLGEEGVAPSLVAAAASGLLISWWYSRKVEIERPAMTRVEVRQEATGLLKLGFAFMASGVLMMGASYAVRTIVLRTEGLDAAGFYSAAWTLGGLYVGIILQAMGADFYPRLVGVATDNPQCNRLVNEQTQVSLLLAGPGVIATLVFAPLVISLFYSAKFAEAVEVLRWICLGVALRVITWPIGFIIVAKNRQAIFIGTEVAWTVVNVGLTWFCVKAFGLNGAGIAFFGSYADFGAEVAWTVVNVGLTWFCVKAFGLNGAGIAFFGSYVFHGVMIYAVVRRLSGFRWSGENVQNGSVVSFIHRSGVLRLLYALPSLWATALGTVMTLLSGFYSTGVLLCLVPLDRLPHPIHWLLVRLRSYFVRLPFHSSNVNHE